MGTIVSLLISGYSLSWQVVLIALASDVILILVCIFVYRKWLRKGVKH